MNAVSKIIIFSTLVLALTSCSAFAPKPTETPIPTATRLPTATLSPTLTITPTPTALPTPTPIINDANFVPPVDPKIVPLYNAFDLNSQIDKVKPQSAKYPPRENFYCNGSFFFPRTPDNHYGWDYGTGNCSKHLVGTKVYGMSVGFYGTVISVGRKPEDYATRIDYGDVECTDGKVRHIVIQFAHSIPLVKIGDLVDSTTPIAELEFFSVEVEIQVFGNNYHLNPQLIGLKLP